MKVGLQSILLSHYDDMIKKYRLPKRVLVAADAIMKCRTAAMGGHVEKCPEGHVEKVWYNSCKHRSCPRCGHLPTERWLAKQKARLLACDHHHVIFTLPQELRHLWRHNREIMMDLLFRVVRETLFTLLADRRYGGLVPGMLCSLHTWGRNLSFHPHVHCLVTAGGLCDGRTWARAKKENLLPYRVVRELYRGKMIAAVREALHQGKLLLPPELPAFKLENTLNRLGREPWNVEIRQRYSHGNGVLIYLARYVRGGPISDSRIVSCSATSVSFRYFDHKDGTAKVMQLTPEAFLLRALDHVPPPHKKTVRYYGLYAESNLGALDAGREALGQEGIESPEFLTWEAFWKRTHEELPNLCPVCKRPLMPGPRLRRRSRYDPRTESRDERAA